MQKKVDEGDKNILRDSSLLSLSLLFACYDMIQAANVTLDQGKI